MTYPMRMWFIIVMEFCERFSFSSLRCERNDLIRNITLKRTKKTVYFIAATLSFYMRNVLMYEERQAVDIYHVFMMLCYISAIIGGIVGNSFYGKYK